MKRKSVYNQKQYNEILKKQIGQSFFEITFEPISASKVKIAVARTAVLFCHCSQVCSVHTRLYIHFLS